MRAYGQEGDELSRQIDGLQKQLDRLKHIQAAQLEDEVALQEAVDGLADLAESLARFPEGNPNPVLRVNPGGSILYANPAGCKTLLAGTGCKTGHMLPAQLVGPVQEAAATGQIRQMDLVQMGRVFTLDIVPLPAGGYVNIYGREVTEQRAAEGALRNSEARYRELVEEIPAATFIVPVEDPAKPTFVSPQIEELAGYTPQEWIEIEGVWRNCLHPDDRERVLGELQRAVARKTSFESEYRLITRTGQVKWIEEQAKIILDDAGQASCWQGILLDVTARKRDEALIERYRFLSEHARDILLLLRLSDGRVLEANLTAEKAYGYTRDELLSLTTADLRTPETFFQIPAQLAAANSTGILFETTHRRKDGSVFNVEVSSIGVDFGGERVLLSVIRDITERKQAELALRESQERNRQLVELSPDAIFVHADGKLVYVNPAGLQLFGAERPEQLVGQPVLDRVHPASRSMVARRLEQMSRKRAVLPLVAEQYLRLDGTLVDAEVVATPINYDNQPAVLVLARDITERKRAEAMLRESEAQARANAVHVELQHFLMEQRERERAQIARDIHDGPMQRLAAINYELESVIGEIQTDSTRNGLKDVEAALSREIGELRAYSNHLRPPVLSRFGLEAGIRSYAVVFQEQYPNLVIQVNASARLPALSQRVRLAFFRIFQEALYNVAEHSGATEVAVRISATPARVKLEVRDNGSGFGLIPGELELARQGKLGLAGMREYAEAIGGTFHIQSWPGKGTVVRVTAPLEEEEAVQSETNAA